MILKCIAISILITPLFAIGEEVSKKDIALKTYLIQIAYFTATSVCEDPSREYYKKSLSDLLDTGKKYSELTDADKLALRKKHRKYKLDCHSDVLGNNKHKNDNLVKIYCYELYLNRYDSVAHFLTEVEFFDKEGGASDYIKDILKEIETDTEFDLKAAECFKEINKLHHQNLLIE